MFLSSFSETAEHIEFWRPLIWEFDVALRAGIFFWFGGTRMGGVPIPPFLATGLV
jgi:hypothetical protein